MAPDHFLPGHEDALSDAGALPVEGMPDTPKVYEPFWKRIGQSLSEDDLKSGAVMKMLVNETHRLSEENLELRKLRDEFHQADKAVAVLTATSGQATAFSALVNFLIAVGGVVAGIGGSLASSGQWVLGLMVIACGLTCIAVPHVIKEKSK